MRIPAKHMLTDWLVKNVLEEKDEWKFHNDCDEAFFFLNRERKTFKETKAEKYDFGLLTLDPNDDKVIAEDILLEHIEKKIKMCFDDVKDMRFDDVKSDTAEFHKIRTELDSYSFAQFLTDKKVWQDPTKMGISTRPRKKGISKFHCFSNEP